MISRLDPFFARDSFEQSRNTLLALLAPFDQWLPFKPGDKNALPLDIDIIKKEVEMPEGVKKEIQAQSVRFLGEERLYEVTSESQEYNWSHLFGPTTTTAKQIKSELSDNYAIPEWAIQVHLNISDYTERKIIIPSGKILQLDRSTLNPVL